MMVLPAEISGLSWRPSAEELRQPNVNLRWGTGILKQILRDSGGDLFKALAAYNGGWGQIHLRVTRRYAADLLTNYARAVAVRSGLPVDGDWVAIFAVEGTPDPHTITVINPKRSPARYTERPWDQTDIPTVPAGTPPHATVIAFETEPAYRSDDLLLSSPGCGTSARHALAWHYVQPRASHLPESSQRPRFAYKALSPRLGGVPCKTMLDIRRPRDGAWSRMSTCFENSYHPLVAPGQSLCYHGLRITVLRGQEDGTL